jgi:hypothetical protein
MRCALGLNVFRYGELNMCKIKDLNAKIIERKIM